MVSDVSENKRIHFTSWGEKIGKDVCEFTVVVWLIDGFCCHDHIITVNNKCVKFNPFILVSIRVNANS